MDDGSTDETDEIIYSFKNSRIRYTRHKHNKGAAAARNTGIKIARGRCIAFQDSDDESFPDRLERQVEALNCNPKISIVYGNMIRVFQNGYEHSINVANIGYRHTEAHNAFICLKAKNIGIGTCMIRKSCFEDIGHFDTNLHRFEELDFFIRASRLCYFYKIDAPVIKYYEVDRDEIKMLDSALSARKYLLKKYYRDISINKTCLAIHYFGIGNDLCYLGNTHEGKEYILKSLQLKPFNIKYITAIAMSFMGDSVYNKLVKQKNDILNRIKRLLR